MPETVPGSGPAAAAGSAPGVPVRVLFLDADGTLTDGVIVETPAGDARNFWVRDGLSLLWAKRLAVLPVVISGRPSAAVQSRMRDLDVECHVDVSDKVEVARRILEREGVAWEACAMIGDDLPDVPLLKRVGWPIAVADAQPEVRAIAHTVTAHGGGRGAAREAVELILRHNGTWEQVLRRYEVAS